MSIRSEVARQSMLAAYADDDQRLEDLLELLDAEDLEWIAAETPKVVAAAARLHEFARRLAHAKRGHVDD